MLQCLQHMLGVGQKGVFVMYQPSSTSVIIESSSLPENDLEEVQRKNFFSVDFIFRGGTGYVNQISAQKHLVLCCNIANHPKCIDSI